MNCYCFVVVVYMSWVFFCLTSESFIHFCELQIGCLDQLTWRDSKFVPRNCVCFCCITIMILEYVCSQACV